MSPSGSTRSRTAQAMFVTPNAVDFQLGEVYRKLGVSSRGELAAALAAEPASSAG